MKWGALVRNVANVVNLSTPLGLACAALGRGRFRIVDGLVVADRVRLPLVTASAMTIGSVVLVPGAALEEASGRIPGLLAHEEEHTYQYAYCLGIPFLPLYVAAVGWSWLRSGDRATANHFEKQAGLALGGYPVGELRSVGAGIADLRGRLRRRRA